MTKCASFTNAVVDTVAKTASAVYAAPTVEGLVWLGRSLVFPVDTTGSKTQGQPANNGTDIQERIVQLASAGCAAFVGVLKSPVGMATVGCALADSVIERSCDAIERISHKTVSRRFVREPAKLASAAAIYFGTGAVYYAAGTKSLPAIASYAGYRAVSHFAGKLYTPAKAATAKAS